MATLTFRNSQGELVDIPTVAASRFKNEFGAIFEQAALGGAIAISKHDQPKAVLLSYAEFESLVASRSPALDDLSAQFDGLLVRMQTPRARRGMAAAFNASPAGLGRAAVKAAAKRR
jgi:prevent-host-death family protein